MTVVVEHVAPWIALKPALTTAEQQNVLAHEMLHALLTPQARATQPLWLTEGFAQLQIRRKDAVSAFYTPAVTSNPADLNALARRVFGADIAGLTRQWQTSYSAELRKLAG